MSSFSKGSKRSAFLRGVLVLLSTVVIWAMLPVGDDLTLLVGSVVTFALCYRAGYLGECGPGRRDPDVL